MEEKALQPWQNAIKVSEPKFQEIIEATGNSTTYAVESMFAFQAILKNAYLQKIANENPNSLRDAVINIASIGISLNPAMQYAYLVPRDGVACLDISYKGLIKLATDTGSMLWVRADIVYENDKFIYHGPAEKPEHDANVFGDRGEFKGVYCIAKTREGDFLIEAMTAEDVFKARDASKAWKKSKSGPWKDWFGEMAKKTIIKRASKTWPRTDKHDRIAQAISVINEHEVDEYGPEERNTSYYTQFMDKAKTLDDLNNIFTDYTPDMVKDLGEEGLLRVSAYCDQLAVTEGWSTAPPDHIEEPRRVD